MAAPRKQKLKVFQAQIGFYDTVVAAPSRQAALRAWGVHQNLFAGGQAAVVTDKDAVAAAVAHPEVVLKRPAGSSGPFQSDSRRQLHSVTFSRSILQALGSKGDRGPLFGFKHVACRAV